MKKKLSLITLLLLTFLLTMCFIACSNNSTTTNNNNNTNNNNTTNTNPSSKHDHQFVESIMTTATCGNPGKKKFTCSICDGYYTEEYSVGEHEYQESIITVAECGIPGTKKYTCSKCNDSYTEEYSIGNHEYTESIYTIAKCGIPGIKKYTCSKCNDSYTEEYSIGNHEYQESIYTIAKCGIPGIKKYTCSKCNDYYTEEYSIGNHEYTESIYTEATCNRAGSKKFTCSRCYDYYTEEYYLSELVASDVYVKVKNSIGEIITYNKSGSELALGSCFVYESAGKFITNYHVIEGAYSAKITINGNTYTVNKILAFDKNIDLAVLKVSATNLPTVKICKNEHAVGKTVYAIGSSKGLTSTFSQGIITHANREIDGVNYVQHDAAISSGNSGGPLVNGFGEIIGINTMSVRDSQNLNFAIMAKELNNLDFSKSMTFEEFNQSDMTAFDKLKTYIIKYGTYDSTNRQYKVTSSLKYWNSSYKYQDMAYYEVDDDQIQFSMFMINNSGSYGILSSVEIDKNISGNYNWTIVTTDYDGMGGTLYASTFTYSTTLYYSYKIGFYNSATDAKKVAAQSIYQTLSNIKYNFSSLGISAKDFGFNYIS